MSRLSRIAAIATGADAITAAATAPFKSAAAIGSGIAQMVRLLKTNKADLPVSLESDDAELAHRLDRQWRRFCAWWFAMFSLVVWALYLTPQYIEHYSLLGAVLPFFPVLPIALQLALTAYGHWQLRTRRLGGLKEWISTPRAWWPDNSGTKLLGLAILFLAVIPGCSWAADALPTTTDTINNIANQIIDALIPADGSTTGLTVAIAVLANLASALGVAGLVWSTLTTNIAAAASGQVMGDRAGAWSVIRICLGMSLLCPTPSGLPVFSAVLVRQVAIGGSALADKAWSAFTSTVLSDSGSTPPGIPPAMGGQQLAEEALRASVCSAVFADIAVHTKGQVGGYGVPVQGGSYLSPMFPYGAKQKWGWGHACGGIAVDVPDSSSDAATQAYSQARIAAVDRLIQGIQNSGIAAQIQAAIVPSVQTDTQPMPTDILAKLQPMAAAYDKAILSASSGLVAAENQAARLKLISTSTAEGWMAAGEYWRALAQLQAQAVHHAAEAPEWAAPVDSLQTKEIDASDDDVKALNSTYKALDIEISTERDVSPTASANDLAKIGDDNGSNLLTRLTAPIDNKVTAALVNLAKTDGTDPGGDEINSGAMLLDASEAGIAGGVVIAAMSGNVLANSAGAGKVFDWVAPFVRSLIVGSGVVGWTQEFLLPMTVWCSVLWLSVSFVLAIVEAMIFGGLWAVMLCKFEGKDLIDSVHRPGIIILANLFFIPVLGILGFIAAYYALPLCMAIVDRQFAAAYVGSQGGHVIGLVGAIGGIGFMSYIQWQVTLRVMTLVHVVPFKMPAWIGMAASGFGEAESQSKSVGGAIVATQGAGRTLKESARSGGDKSGASKVPGAGGEGGASIQPATDEGGTASAEPHWTKAQGGTSGLSEGQQAEAKAAYNEWSASNPEAAKKYGFEGYVNYAQKREAAKAKTEAA